MCFLTFSSAMSGLILQCQSDANKTTALGLLSSIQNLEMKCQFQLRILEDSLNPYLLSQPVLVSSLWPLLCAGQFAALDRSRGLPVDVDDVLPAMPAVSGNPSFLVYHAPVYLRYTTPSVFFNGLQFTKGLTAAGTGAVSSGVDMVGQAYRAAAQRVPAVPLPPDFVSPRVLQARQWLKAKL